MTDLSKLSDPRWRINNLYKIVNKAGKLVDFRENTFQEQVNTSNDPALILKCRQLGISTGCVLKKLDKTIFNEHQNTVILSHEKDSLVKIFRIVDRAIKYMNPQIKPVIAKGGGSKTEFFFPDINSRISVDLESRSDTIQNLHISEIAFMKDMEKVKATIDAVPIGGDVTIESTANGLNHFNELWFQQGSPYKKFFFPWFLTPEYQLPTKHLELTDNEKELVEKAAIHFNHVITHEQIAFRRWKISQKGGGANGLRHFIQEYPEDESTCFLTSGQTIFDLFEIQKMIKNAPEPIFDNGWMKRYLELDKSKTYVCGADVSEGVGGDYSTAYVIEVQTRRIAATIRGHWKPSLFAEHLYSLNKLYSSPYNGWPLLAVEKNNHGHAVLLQLNEHLHYPNLYYRIKGYDENGNEIKDDMPGWVTDKITRPIMVNAAIDAVENKYINLLEINLLGECLTLVNNDGKIEAATNKHDDCFIAFSIALQMLLTSSNLTKYEDLHNKILL
jgi:hypothetical protein